MGILDLGLEDPADLLPRLRQVGVQHDWVAAGSGLAHHKALARDLPRLRRRSRFWRVRATMSQGICWNDWLGLGVGIGAELEFWWLGGWVWGVGVGPDKAVSLFTWLAP